MTVPRLLVITDRRLATAAGHDLRDVLESAVEAGARAVLVRDKDLAGDDRLALAKWARSLLTPVEGTVLVSSGPTSVADGVQFTATDAVPEIRPPVMGRSCHDEDELSAAAEEGCDYATLSPIFATPTKPGYGPTLGVDRLRDAPLPVLALGGVTPANAASCLRAGAAGIAVMGGVMSASDPRVAVSSYLEMIAGVTA